MKDFTEQFKSLDNRIIELISNKPITANQVGYLTRDSGYYESLLKSIDQYMNVIASGLKKKKSFRELSSSEETAYFKVIGSLNKYFGEWSKDDQLKQLDHTGHNEIKLSDINGLISDGSKKPVEKLMMLAGYLKKNVLARRDYWTDVEEQFRNPSSSDFESPKLIDRSIKQYIANNHFKELFFNEWDLEEKVDEIHDNVFDELVTARVISAEGSYLRNRLDYDYEKRGKILKIISPVMPHYLLGKSKKAVIFSNKPVKKAISNFSSGEKETIDLGRLVLLKESEGFDKVAGLSEVKELLETEVIYPLKYPQLSTGKKFGGIILYGPPGCGKTLIASAIPGEVNKKVISVSGADILSKWVGESEKYVKQLFSKARKENAILFIDEIESLIPGDVDRNHEMRLVSQFLHEMDGAENKADDKVIVIGATNNPWNIYGPFLRPERFGKQIYVGLPDDKAKLAILRINLSKSNLKLSKSVSLEEIIGLTDGFSGADVAAIATEVESEYKKECVRKIKEIEELELPKAEKDQAISLELNKLGVIKKDDLLGAVSKIKPSVSEQLLKKYELWGANPKGKSFGTDNSDSMFS